MDGQYSDKVMEHFRNPHNVGEIPDADGIGNVGNPVCVAEGTLVKCNNHLAPIENIIEGKARVLSHDGKYHVVTRVFKRKYAGKVFNILNGASKEIRLTPEHHVLSLRNDASGNKRDKIYDWMMPEELRAGDLLLFPRKGGGFRYSKIRKISKSRYSGYVYDLEVKGAHSYVTKAATLHNCGDIMRLYIKVDPTNEIITDAKFKTFGCLPPEAELVVANGGWRKISETTERDRVVNRNGSEATIAETFKKNYSGPMIDIIPFVSPHNRFSVTSGHPVLTIKRDSLKKSRRASNKCDWLRVNQKELFAAEPAYIEARHLEKSDYLVFNVNHKVKDSSIFTKGIMRLLGYYLSEGYLIAKGRAVAVAFNKKEKKAIDEVKSLVFGFIGKEMRGRIRGNVHEIWCSSTKLAQFLKTHAGSIAREKRLSKDIMLLPYNKQKELIKTYLIGDGDVDRRRPGDSFTYRAVTTSSAIAIQVQQILARGGIFSSIKETLKSGGLIEGRKIKPSLMYVVSFKLERTHKFVHKIDKTFLVPIKDVKKRIYEGPVYNLRIQDETNSYLVKGFAVHNCGAAIATSSMVTDIVKGKTIAEALKISNHAVAEALGGLPKIKMHCSVLAEQALRSAINDYLTKHGKPTVKEPRSIHEDSGEPHIES